MRAVAERRNYPGAAPPLSYSMGFTLIEVLIALVVISIGLLGLLTLQIRSLHASHSAYLTSVASVQAMDLEERIRANRGVAASYSSVDLSGPASNISNLGCSNNACSPAQLVNYDLHQWLTTTRALFPGSLSVSLTEPSTDVFKLTFDWSEPNHGDSDTSRSFTYRFRLVSST